MTCLRRRPGATALLPPHRILRPRSYPPAMRRSCSRSKISNTRPAERM